MNNILTVERRPTWACWYLSLAPVFVVHWHVGWSEDLSMDLPRIRLRAVFLFGWKLPLHYHVY